MWIGEDKETSPVNIDYKFRGIDNVYLTGGALWPTGASWNPTCTMTAMAMDLGDRLSRESPTNKL
jgi:choline dehydrogenase-like flavoprotein